VRVPRVRVLRVRVLRVRVLWVRVPRVRVPRVRVPRVRVLRVRVLRVRVLWVRVPRVRVLGRLTIHHILWGCPTAGRLQKSYRVVKRPIRTAFAAPRVDQPVDGAVAESLR
jgi:hypothetical protein